MSTEDQSQQLSLKFPARSATFDDLVITDCNRVPLAAIQRPEAWPNGVFCLVGPEKSGLTTAGHAWATAFDGYMITAAQFDQFSLVDIEKEANRAFVIDRADLFENESALLTLLNMVNRRGGYVLLLSRRAPALWPVDSADLASRLRAMPSATIDAPDEEMICAYLEEAGRQRHIKLEPNVVSFLATRLETSYLALHTFISHLDRHISDTGRGATIPEVKKVLAQMSGERALRDDGA